MKKFIALLVLLSAVGIKFALSRNGDTTPSIESPTQKIAADVRWHSGNLHQHWQKHKGEFPEFSSAKEYGDAAVAFFLSPPVGTQTKTNPKGDTLFFYEPDNNFGVITKDGYIKTFFKPNAGVKYWNRQ